MEALLAVEMTVVIYQSTRRNIPQKFVCSLCIFAQINQKKTENARCLCFCILYSELPVASRKKPRLRYHFFPVTLRPSVTCVNISVLRRVTPWTLVYRYLRFVRGWASGTVLHCNGVVSQKTQRDTSPPLTSDLALCVTNAKKIDTEN